MLPSVSLTPYARYIKQNLPHHFFNLLFLHSFAFTILSKNLTLSAETTTNSSSSAEGMPPRFSSTTTKERYHTIVAAKNKWEEQGFLFDDTMEYYGLEPLIYKRLYDLGWLRFGRQPAKANLNWVREFYANNAEGDDAVIIRGRRVTANSATINDILRLPNDDPIIYALIRGLEDEDYETIKDYLCEQDTKWSTTGKNPGAFIDPSLQPEARLWNTFVKCNLMPTSDNQIVDCTRLVLINVIITGYRFNVGEVIANELSLACRNELFATELPCLPTPPTNGHQIVPAGRERTAAPDQVGSTAPVEAQPSPAATPEASPINNTAHTPALTPEVPDSRQTTPDSPLGSAPSLSPSPSPAQSEEAIPLHILQLRSQLQRIEARQLQFMEETKVFQTSIINFLCFQFQNAAAFFTAQPTTTHPTNHSTATQPMPPADPFEGAGNTEEVHFSVDAENDIFDWHTPMEHHAQPDAADVPESSTAQKHKAPAPTTEEILSVELPMPDASTRRKGKTPAGWTITRNTTSSPDDEEQITPRPAKRQRRGSQVIITDSDDSSGTEQPVENPEQSIDPSLSLILFKYFLPSRPSHDAKAQYLDCITWLPETGSRRILLYARGAWISARNDQHRQIKECTKKQQIQAERSCTDAALDQKTQNSPRQKNEYQPKTPASAGKKYIKGNAI
ncbi:hypothetical protein V6N13_006207 [Hibiscus sabdariffa]